MTAALTALYWRWLAGDRFDKSKSATRRTVKQQLPKSAIVAFVIVDALIVAGFIYYILSG